MELPHSTLNCKGRLVVLNEPIIMGIINTTPDSFYAGSRVVAVDQVLEKAEQMLKEGASIIDVGGMSSRPGAAIINKDQEKDRVLEVISALKSNLDPIISIDTIHADVAKEAVHAGAAIVNDISAGKIDSKMYETVAKLDVPYILMHMKGKPETMQSQTNYVDVVEEVLDFLIAEVGKLRSLMVKDIIIDPGFGFGKTIEQNYALLQKMHVFKLIGLPILSGISRKSMVYKALNIEATEALNGTSALHMVALQQGAKILRVHDVKEAKEVIELYKLLELAAHG